MFERLELSGSWFKLHLCNERETRRARLGREMRWHGACLVVVPHSGAWLSGRQLRIGILSLGACVISLSGGGDEVEVVVGPGGKRLHDSQQASPHGGQRVFNSRRHAGMDSARDDAVAFQIAQGRTEH